MQKKKKKRNVLGINKKPGLQTEADVEMLLEIVCHTPMSESWEAVTLQRWNGASKIPRFKNGSTREACVPEFQDRVEDVTSRITVGDMTEDRGDGTFSKKPPVERAQGGWAERNGSTMAPVEGISVDRGWVRSDPSVDRTVWNLTEETWGQSLTGSC